MQLFAMCITKFLKFGTGHRILRSSWLCISFMLDSGEIVVTDLLEFFIVPRNDLVVF